MSGVNDFAFKMATVNGTGSASANSLLMQAIFRMGIPVTGKNLFPSNIQGLPTFYEIRVSKDGYTARPSEIDLVVTLNPSTYAKDVASVTPGGYLLYDSSWPLEPELVREGVTIRGIPFGKMCVDNFVRDRDRTLLRNIVYAGALAAFLKIDMDIVSQMLVEKFSKKKALFDANNTAIKLGYDYASNNYQCPLPFHLEQMDETKDSIIIDGNTSAALGAVYAGATVGAWYPITPSTSLMEAFTMFCRKFRTDPETGLGKYCILQAEDELSAAGIAIGAGWAGARAFTNTSGPGISLMQEFIGLAYYTEIPAVFYDIQRTGPSTGMPTRTQQADLLSLAYASHGDTKHIVLFPCSPEECFYMSPMAFDLADRFQTPVFVASDLDIGMNDWMCRRLTWDDAYVPDRGKCLTAADLESVKKFSRYLDAEGDGIAARSLPGVHGNGAYFVRGSGHDKHGMYTEDSDSYQEVVDRLARKFKLAATKVPAPEFHRVANADVGIVSLGGCHAAILEALDKMKALGINADYMRIRAFPFDTPVREFLDAHQTIFVVEQNRDAQLRSLLAIETGKPRDDMISVLDYGGMPLTARVVVSAVTATLTPAG
ncbi:MAG: putative 2-oxoglutarate ferredoxin-oxidoreductase alpha subunit [Gemmatimonadetes bacterium]|nr:putative 2-oxoglutarate ferredoxin-oxidoreductase alpha subunit [Gemmatimonadota bacterium]